MKKFLLAAVFFGGTIFSNVQAQFTGGSAGRETINAPATTKKADTDKGVFDNAFYFKIGKSAPVGKFGAAPNMSYSGFDSFNGVDGSGAQGGLNFEIGLLSYLRSIELQEQFKVGIDAGLGFSGNSIDWTTMDENFDDTERIPFVFVGFKIGPAFSYNVVDKLIVDAFFKLNPCLSTGPDIYYYESNGAGNYYSYSLDNDDQVNFSVRKSLGLNLRYSALLLGMELNYGKVSTTLYESASSKTNGIETLDYDRAMEVKMPTSTILWTIGVKF